MPPEPVRVTPEMVAAGVKALRLVYASGDAKIDYPAVEAALEAALRSASQEEEQDQPTVSEKHPHEPEIPPVLDAEGRCRVCALLVQLADTALAAGEAEASLVSLTEAAREMLDAFNDIPAQEPQIPGSGRRQQAWTTLRRALADTEKKTCA